MNKIKKNKILKLGVFGLILVGVFWGVWLAEQNVRSLRLWIFNIHEEINETHKQLKELKDRPSSSAQSAQNFSTQTRNWLFTENQTFGFQFKSPFDWGAFAQTCTDNYCQGNFVNRPSNPEVSFGQYSLVQDYDLLRSLVQTHELGFCHDDFFDRLKKIGQGELRYCEIRENVLGQKYLLFRFYDEKKSAETSFEALLPNQKSFILVKKIVLDDEGKNFLAGFIFQTQ
ncbi:MAG: hypothetical protein WCT18_02330 [Patescibacteria group bacterium]